MAAAAALAADGGRTGRDGSWTTTSLAAAVAAAGLRPGVPLLRPSWVVKAFSRRLPEGGRKGSCHGRTRAFTSLREEGTTHTFTLLHKDAFTGNLWPVPRGPEPRIKILCYFLRHFFFCFFSALSFPGTNLFSSSLGCGEIFHRNPHVLTEGSCLFGTAATLQIILWRLLNLLLHFFSFFSN